MIKHLFFYCLGNYKIWICGYLFCIRIYKLHSILESNGLKDNNEKKSQRKVHHKGAEAQKSVKKPGEKSFIGTLKDKKA